eukprot:903464-Prymnesium_polylepis.1
MKTGRAALPRSNGRRRSSSLRYAECAFRSTASVVPAAPRIACIGSRASASEESSAADALQKPAGASSRTTPVLAQHCFHFAPPSARVLCILWWSLDKYAMKLGDEFLPVLGNFVESVEAIFEIDTASGIRTVTDERKHLRANGAVQSLGRAPSGLL